MQVAGTTVVVTDVEAGVALDYTTSPEHLDRLRERVQHLADVQNQRSEGSGKSMSHGQMMGGGMHAGMGGGGMMSPAATASVEQIERGARLVLRPVDSAQLETLRQYAHMRADHMVHEHCPMMSAHAQQTPAKE